MPMMAPFETFREHGKRAASKAPYSDAFIARCREAALKYDKEDDFLRGPLLRDLRVCIPLHRRGEVFDGISVPEYRRLRGRGRDLFA